MWIFRILKYFFITFSAFLTKTFLSSNITEVYREQVPCPLNSSHSFWQILLKFYRCFEDDLKICMWFFRILKLFLITFYMFWTCEHVRMIWRYACGFSESLNYFWSLFTCFEHLSMWIFQNPEVIFYHFFRTFNLDIFWVLILRKCIGCRYLVPLTPPTVFGRSFGNFTWAFRMAWKYAYGVFRILK